MGQNRTSRRFAPGSFPWQHSTKTYQQASTAHISTQASKVTARQSLRLTRLGHIVAGTWVLLAAMATSANLGLVQLVEAQAQTLFFELRGPVAPPDNIVILAIDEPSLSVPGQYYRIDPQQYSYLEPLKAWPWKRSAYAQVIERIMAAGARSVAVDILFANPSSYGLEDDQRLAQVLQRYAGKVTLATQYEQSQMRQGSLIQLTQPESLLWTKPMSVGSVNFPLEPDGKIHRFAREFSKLLAHKYQQQSNNFKAMPSFEQAAVAAAKLGNGGRLNVNSPNQVKHKGDRIHFYGPAGTFEQISFWHVLDPVNWNTYLQQGKYFKNKIVIIGATADLQDFHPVPFAQSWLYPEPISGVEIQANAIATLLEDKAISEVITNPKVRGLFVLLFIAGIGFLLTKPKHALNKFILAIGIAIAWATISYFSFVYIKLILPTTVPIVAIVLSGCSYLATEAISDNLRKLRLRQTLERYASFPVVQEIISQQDDLQYLLQQRSLVTVGKTLGGRYKIVKVLGSGGFSETYVAEDNQRPGNPLCVVKQLRPVHHKPQHLQLARRLFKLEAETLEKLGTHNQIPQLFAYFEQEEEFYLVQELIVGHPLSLELKGSKPIAEAAVIQILWDLLHILEFVHSHNVVHRDIKPSNIMRRHCDRKLVLIDFGAVKQISARLLDEAEQRTSLTVGIGTLGYAPPEQYAGHAFFSSDIYAVGMTAIKALTGSAPHELEIDSKTGELLWSHQTEISSELTAILAKMINSDFTQRYQSVSELKSALSELAVSTDSLVLGNSSTDVSLSEDLDTTTKIWVPLSTEIPSGIKHLPPS